MLMVGAPVIGLQRNQCHVMPLIQLGLNTFPVFRRRPLTSALCHAPLPLSLHTSRRMASMITGLQMVFYNRMLEVKRSATVLRRVVDRFGTWLFDSTHLDDEGIV